MKDSASPTTPEGAVTYTGRQDDTNDSRIREMHDLFMPQQFYPPGKRFITMEELKAHFGREESTIRRCFETMRTMWDLHVGYIPERRGYGYTEPVAGFPLATIAERQLYDLIQSIQFIALHKEAAHYRKLRKLVKDACAGVTTAMGLTFEEVEEALSFHVVGFDAPAPVDPELFRAAVQAILKRKEVRIEHHSVKRIGEVTEHTVEPLHVSMINHAMYLWHWDPVRKETRKFALTRIGKFSQTGRTFRRRKFDIQAEMGNGMGAFNEKNRTEVRLRFRKEIAPLILERRWHRSQRVELLPGNEVELRLDVSLSPELDAFILRWAGGVEVLAPESLRKRVHELGKALAEMNRADGRGTEKPEGDSGTNGAG